MTNETGPTTEAGIRPIVARSRAGLPTWLLAVVAVGAALLLFFALDARRRSGQAPAVAARAIDLPSLPSSVPPLDIPPEPALPEPSPPTVMMPPPPAQPSSRPIPSPAYPQSTQPPVLLRAMPTGSPLSPPSRSSPSLTSSGGSTVVLDTSTPAPTTDGQRPANNSAGASAAGATPATARVHAGMLQNRSTTVVQGTLLHAVLETGFDSTRPGFARAIVSRDIRGFDGSRILVPRGSRLIGEYQADVRAGQKRALIIWNRLIRPDGATIEIGSPASDPVGRGGIKAKVDTHFLERFSGAILQSALDIGVNLASRSVDRSVIVALPSGGSGSTQIVQPAAIAPTLKVAPATSISIFVARDLDFTEVETRP